MIFGARKAEVHFGRKARYNTSQLVGNADDEGTNTRSFFANLKEVAYLAIMGAGSERQKHDLV